MTDFSFFTSGSKSGSEGKDAVDAFLATGDAQQILKRDDAKAAKSLRSSIAAYLATLEDGWRIKVRLSKSEVGLLDLTHASLSDGDLTHVLAKPAAGAVVGMERVAGAAFEPEDRKKIQAEWIEKQIAMVKEYREANPPAEAAA